MKKVYVIVIAILFFHLKMFAHPRSFDILIWKGDTLKLYPLELREDFHSLIEQLIVQIEEDFDDFFFCLRYYNTEWIILNDSIFLNNIYSCNSGVQLDLNTIFPNIGKNQKVFASWINEDLYVPQGNYILDSDLYEQEIVLNVEGGLLKKYETYNNRIIKFESFNKIEPYEYSRFFYKNINWKNLPDLTNKSITVFIAFYPNEQGKIEYIDEKGIWFIETTLNENFTSVFDKYESSIPIYNINNVFIQEGIRIVKLIPGWDVLYKGGKICAINLIIAFSNDKKTFYVSSFYSK